MSDLYLEVFLLLLCLSLHFTAISSIGKESPHAKRFPPCKACKVFVQSIENGVKRTEKSNFAGGNSAWEEKHLSEWAKSEVRLVEIQDLICTDVEEGKDQCYTLREEHESLLEHWWAELQEAEPDLYKHICIDRLRVCCPPLHFGPDCTACAGHPNDVCNNNGKCKGAGTRKGSGKCVCNDGYGGDACGECAAGYYVAYEDEGKQMCTKCHVSCKGNCNKAGHTGCEECADGWTKVEGRGCLDINECVDTASVCNSSQFCVNSEGSFRCLECDDSCAGCTGDGPDMCIACAAGYVLIGNMCTDAQQQQSRQHMYISRYLMYLGLCIATCIIFQKNTVIASVIGVMVGIYIAAAEFFLNRPQAPHSVTLL